MVITTPRAISFKTKGAFQSNLPIIVESPGVSTPNLRCQPLTRSSCKLSTRHYVGAEVRSELEISRSNPLCGKMCLTSNVLGPMDTYGYSGERDF